MVDALLAQCDRDLREACNLLAKLDRFVNQLVRRKHLAHEPYVSDRQLNSLSVQYVA